MPPEPTYWHGSLEPLAVGSALLPASKQSDTSLTVPSRLAGLYDLDLVYFTTHRDYARAWVARAGGALMRVEPRGPISPDIDTGNVGFCSPTAVVVEVEESPVTMSMREVRKTFARIEPDRYDAHGFAVPHGDFLSDFVACGLTADHCRKLGRWINPRRIVRDPYSNEMRYETDDVALMQADLAHQLVEEGHSREDASRVVQRADVVRDIASAVARRPIPWL